MTQSKPPALLTQRLDDLAADIAAYTETRGRKKFNSEIAHDLDCTNGTLTSLLKHYHRNVSRLEMAIATSSSSAEAKPMAINTPHSTETKTDAGDTAQVAAQTSPAPPMTQTPKGREFLRATVIQLAMVLLMVVFFLISTQSWMQEYSAATVAVITLAISIQLLIGISLFL